MPLCIFTGENMDILIHILIKIGLIGLGMLLKMAEISITHAGESALDSLAQKGNRKAKRVLSLNENPSAYTASVRTAISTVEFISSALAVIHFSHYISHPIASLGIPSGIAEAIGILAVSLVYITVTVILIALVARHIALKNSLKIALGISGFALFVYVIFRPFSAFISICSKGILKLMHINPEVQESLIASEEAIKQLVDAGSENGTIGDEEKEFIENVFNFDDLSADEIATHRKEITLLWADETDEEWEKTIYQSHHTYFPICDEKIDNIVGVLNSKEYFRIKNKSRENVMKHAVKSPFFIPETMKANMILKSMKQKRTYFAVVIDEYGGLSGIVTVNDILQCIIGEIYEDSDAPKTPDIQPLDSKNWIILGQASIDDVEDALGIKLDTDYDTFAGYVLTMVDEIPDDGVTFTVENELMTVKVTSIKDHRILKTNVRLKEKLAEENS